MIKIDFLSLFGNVSYILNIDTKKLVWQEYRIFEKFGGSKQLNICNLIADGQVKQTEQSGVPIQQYGSVTYIRGNLVYVAIWVPYQYKMYVWVSTIKKSSSRPVGQCKTDNPA